jgi:hypothetical protein
MVRFEYVAVTETGQTIKIQTLGVRRVNNFVLEELIELAKAIMDCAQMIRRTFAR